MAAITDPDSYYRVYKALHLVTHEAIPCVDKCLSTWHANQALPSCTGQCPVGKKPKSPASCQECVAWGQAVEAAAQQPPAAQVQRNPQLTWSNVNSSNLGKRHVETAKAFVLRLPHKSCGAGHYNSIADFDSASLLMIMARFTPFHVGTTKSYHDAIMKVATIRNELSHMGLKDNMQINDQTVKQCFQDIDDFVTCLENLHPQDFTTAQDIKKKLTEIITESVTSRMKEEINLELRRDLRDLSRKMDDLADRVSKTELRTTEAEIPNEEQQGDILQQLQEELRFYYLNSLCKIPLFPGDYDSCVSLQDIYTKLSLEINLPDPCRPIKIPLASYDEMFTRKTLEGYFHTKLLVSGSAGLGKTTLSAKMAYDWATQVEASPLRDFTLLFVLNMRWIDQTSNLEDAIASQILADDTTLTSDQIRNMIEKNKEKVVIILDAVDESNRELYRNREGSGNVVKILMSRHLTTCRPLVTTRPWRISEVKGMCQSMFTQVELKGFDQDDARKYIRKFFKQDKTLGDSLIEHLCQNPLAAEIVSMPLMTLLICTNWKEVAKRGLPRKISELYNAIINIMHRHFSEKNKMKNLPDIPPHDDDVKHLVCRMGKMALQGFWPPENRVVFSHDEAANSEDVQMALRIGLVSQQEVRTTGILTIPNRKQTTLTFFHKTLGEKCAGEFLANFADKNPEEMLSKLSALETVNDALSVQLILQFASGSSIRAAEMIMQKLMQIFECELKPFISKYVDEDLELDITKTIHQFIDLFLKCNYEAGSKGLFNRFMEDLFPDGDVYFFGISSLTAVALRYYLTHSQHPHFWYITLRPSTHLTSGYRLKGLGPLTSMFHQTLKTTSNISVRDMQRICGDFVESRPNMHTKNAYLASSAPALFMSYIQMWQACEGLPAAQESNIEPIIQSIQYIHMKVLDINEFKLHTDTIDILLLMIEKGYLSQLEILDVRGIGMNGIQTDRIATEIKKFPQLRSLDISHNESNRSLSILAESLPSMPSLQRLDVKFLSTSVDDITKFISTFNQYGSHVLVLKMNDNPMNDIIASRLALHLPIARLLMVFSVSVDGLSKLLHNRLLSTMSHLARLRKLQIWDSQYPDDMIVSVASAMQYMPALHVLTLDVANDTAAQVNSNAWHQFMASLQRMTHLRFLHLQHIALEKNDFTDLVSFGRRMEYGALGYYATCVPEGVDVPSDDFMKIF